MNWLHSDVNKRQLQWPNQTDISGVDFLSGLRCIAHQSESSNSLQPFVPEFQTELMLRHYGTIVIKVKIITISLSEYELNNE